MVVQLLEMLAFVEFGPVPPNFGGLAQHHQKLSEAVALRGVVDDPLGCLHCYVALRDLYRYLQGGQLFGVGSKSDHLVLVQVAHSLSALCDEKSLNSLSVLDAVGSGAVQHSHKQEGPFEVVDHIIKVAAGSQSYLRIDVLL